MIYISVIIVFAISYDIHIVPLLRFFYLQGGSGITYSIKEPANPNTVISFLMAVINLIPLEPVESRNSSSLALNLYNKILHGDGKGNKSEQGIMLGMVKYARELHDGYAKLKNVEDSNYFIDSACHLLRIICSALQVSRTVAGVNFDHHEVVPYGAKAAKGLLHWIRALIECLFQKHCYLSDEAKESLYTASKDLLAYANGAAGAVDKADVFTIMKQQLEIGLGPNKSVSIYVSIYEFILGPL